MADRLTFRGMIFDVDGTLGDTHAVLFPAFQAALQAAGVQFSEGEIRARFGPTEQGIIRHLVPPHRAEEAIRVFHDECARGHREHREPYPGIRETLETLHRRGVRLAVATGKGALSAEITLAAYELQSLFDIVVTGSDREFVKPRLLRRVIALWGFPAETVAYVGDAPWDVGAAREVGAQPLSAAWDPSADVEGMRAEEPLALFRSVEEFRSWIEEHVTSEPTDRPP